MSAVNRVASCSTRNKARIQKTSPHDGAACWEDRCAGAHALAGKVEGVYGPVEARVEPMIGDVIVSAAKAVTIVDSRTQAEKAMHLPSVHGSLTMLESDIPCLIDVA